MAEEPKVTVDWPPGMEVVAWEVARRLGRDLIADAERDQDVALLATLEEGRRLGLTEDQLAELAGRFALRHLAGGER